jgi:hypothetical protein
VQRHEQDERPIRTAVANRPFRFREPVMNVLMRTLSVALATLALAGCVGTAMTTDSETGATVPVKGWRTTAWHDDPAWRPFGSLGKKDWREGPWWYGDSAWQFLTVGQGGRPDPAPPAAAVERPADAAPAAAPSAEATDKPAGN